MVYIFYAFLAGLFIWVMTLLGSTAVFATRKLRQDVLNIFVGFAAGIMLAAVFPYFPCY